MLLAFKIMEKAPLRQPRRLADLVHRSGGVALGEHQLLGGVEQLLLGQRIGFGGSHGVYLPVGMSMPYAAPAVKPVFPNSTWRGKEGRAEPQEQWGTISRGLNLAQPPSNHPLPAVPTLALANPALQQTGRLLRRLVRAAAGKQTATARNGRQLSPTVTWRR